MKLKSLLLGTLIFTNSVTTIATESDEATTEIIAEVNGHPITAQTLERYARQRNLPAEIPAKQQREMLLDELINRELIYRDAVNLGVDKTPDIKTELEYQRVNLIAGIMLDRSSDRFQISEEEIKKEYEKRKNELGGKELKARHILLEQEADALKVITELDKGGNFAELAGKHSTGPSAVNGGDLGWFKPGQMVPTFSTAAAELSKGGYTPKPVQTQFGWHIILLEDTRNIEPPPLDSLMEQIRVGLQNRLIETYIAGLHEQAKIQRKEASE
jgi:peptidyl-prolyl cis-trans isomerase C